MTAMTPDRAEAITALAADDETITIHLSWATSCRIACLALLAGKCFETICNEALEEYLARR